MAISTEEVVKYAPEKHEVVTAENRLALVSKYAHEFTDVARLAVGDVIWTPYASSGNHLVVVWVATQRAGLGRNGVSSEPCTLAEGALSVRNGRLELVEESGKRWDLRDGAVVTGP
jgi:hypothetical protein